MEPTSLQNKASLALLVAVYNEQEEILDLLQSVRPFVDTIIVSDDGSTDTTISRVVKSGLADVIVLGEHLASCEETRIRGFKRVIEDWVLILDADERIDAEGMQKIVEFINTPVDNVGEENEITHVYFTQKEYIDGALMRDFAKIKLAKPFFLHLPSGIHDDISCSGEPTNIGVEVVHRKSWSKQIMRETEYLAAYQRKIKEGKMTPERAAQVSGWHYVVKPHG